MENTPKGSRHVLPNCLIEMDIDDDFLDFDFPNLNDSCNC